MFSRSNGPASFALNLYDSNLKDKIDFITEDANDIDDVVKVKIMISKLFKPIGMVLRSLDYYKCLKNNEADILIWNFSILSWYSSFKSIKKKQIVFVNDPYCLENKIKLNYKSIRLFFFSYFESYAVKKADLVVTNSEVIKAMINKKYNINLKKIKVLLKGVKFTDNKLKTNFTINRGNTIEVSFVKSDFVSGGLKMLCDALSINKELKFNIIVIGIKSLPKYFYNYKNVEITLKGKLSQNVLKEVIVNTDFFCIPNLKEAFGQANIEAMSLQIPTVILPSKYQKCLHNADYCYIPKDLSIIELSSIINDLIMEGESEREKRAKRAREEVLKKYSFDKCLSNFNKIINEVN